MKNFTDTFKSIYRKYKNAYDKSSVLTRIATAGIIIVPIILFPMIALPILITLGTMHFFSDMFELFAPDKTPSNFHRARSDTSDTESDTGLSEGPYHNVLSLLKQKNAVSDAESDTASDQSTVVSRSSSLNNRFEKAINSATADNPFGDVPEDWKFTPPKKNNP